MIHTRLLLCVLLAGVVFGCTPKPVHIAQLNTGMTREQVEAVQGKPVNVEKAGDYEALQYHPNFIVILENDRVIAFGEGKLVKYPGSDRFLIEQTSP
jgi:hypothetical protein